MPLVRHRASEQPVSERQRKLRKIDAQYTDGELVKVASASGEAQAEFIAGLLLEEGIPSIIEPAAGGPYAPLMGLRAILVAASAADAARDVLSWGAP